LAVIWNSRKKSGNTFSEDYEKLMKKYGKDYKQVRMNESNIEGFLQYQLKSFYNYQEFDFEGLKGRLMSVSYIPLENDPSFDEMIKELRTLFTSHQINGKIRIEYDTNIYFGKLD
jgi:hypothetical protein